MKRIGSLGVTTICKTDNPIVEGQYPDDRIIFVSEILTDAIISAPEQ